MQNGILEVEEYSAGLQASSAYQRVQGQHKKRIRFRWRARLSWRTDQQPAKADDLKSPLLTCSFAIRFIETLEWHSMLGEGDFEREVAEKEEEYESIRYF